MYLPGPLPHERTGARERILLEYPIFWPDFDVRQREELEPEEECLCEAKILAGSELRLSVIVAPFERHPGNQLHAANHGEITNDPLRRILAIHPLDIDRCLVGQPDSGKDIVHFEGAVAQDRGSKLTV